MRVGFWTIIGSLALSLACENTPPKFFDDNDRVSPQAIGGAERDATPDAGVSNAPDAGVSDPPDASSDR